MLTRTLKKFAKQHPEVLDKKSLEEFFLQELGKRKPGDGFILSFRAVDLYVKKSCSANFADSDFKKKISSCFTSWRSLAMKELQKILVARP